MLENNARDNVYYSVRRGREILTGYTDLHQIRTDPARQAEFTFAESRYLGHEVRIVAVTRRVTQVSASSVVPVADTHDARQRPHRCPMTGPAVVEPAHLVTKD